MCIVSRIVVSRPNAKRDFVLCVARVIYRGHQRRRIPATDTTNTTTTTNATSTKPRVLTSAGDERNVEATLQQREASVSEAAVQREDWQAGRNGGRLLAKGTGHGPRRDTTVVKQALVEALRDPRGGAGKEFFIRLKTGSADDRRTFANVVTKLIPVEVQGDLGEMLKITITTLVAAPNGQPVPTQGMCVIGENASNAPLPAPNESESAVAESEQP